MFVQELFESKPFMKLNSEEFPSWFYQLQDKDNVTIEQLIELFKVKQSAIVNRMNKGQFPRPDFVVKRKQYWKGSTIKRIVNDILSAQEPEIQQERIPFKTQKELRPIERLPEWYHQLQDDDNVTIDQLVDLLNIGQTGIIQRIKKEQFPRPDFDTGLRGRHSKQYWKGSTVKTAIAKLLKKSNIGESNIVDFSDRREQKQFDDYIIKLFKKVSYIYNKLLLVPVPHQLDLSRADEYLTDVHKMNQLHLVLQNKQNEVGPLLQQYEILLDDYDPEVLDNVKELFSDRNLFDVLDAIVDIYYGHF
ncbi:MAG: hypothetical protein ACXW2E_01850 [Nitrososphaeraceae archaeon]